MSMSEVRSRCVLRRIDINKQRSAPPEVYENLHSELIPGSSFEGRLFCKAIGCDVVCNVVDYGQIHGGIQIKQTVHTPMVRGTCLDFTESLS